MVKRILILSAMLVTGCSSLLETCPPVAGVGYDYTGNSGFTPNGDRAVLFSGGLTCNVSDRVTWDTFYINDVEMGNNAWGETWVTYSFGGAPATQIDLKLRERESVP